MSLMLASDRLRERLSITLKEIEEKQIAVARLEAQLGTERYHLLTLRDSLSKQQAFLDATLHQELTTAAAALSSSSSQPTTLASTTATAAAGVSSAPTASSARSGGDARQARDDRRQRQLSQEAHRAEAIEEETRAVRCEHRAPFARVRTSVCVCVCARACVCASAGGAARARR